MPYKPVPFIKKIQTVLLVDFYGLNISMFSIFGREDPDLTIMGLGSPADSVWPVHHIAGQRPHNTAMAGDQHIFIVFGFQFPQEVAAALFQGRNGLNGGRGREYLREGPEKSHGRSHQMVFLLLNSEKTWKKKSE